MAQYNGTIDLISGVRPKNGEDFPLVNAKDIQTKEDGTRLDKDLNDLHNAVDNAGTVKSVSGKTPDANGSIKLTAEDITYEEKTNVKQAIVSMKEATENEVGQLKGDKLDKYVAADAWNEKTYAVGDYCINEDGLYKCKTAHIAQGAFNGDYWTRCNIAQEIAAAGEKYNKAIKKENYMEGDMSITFVERPQILLCIAHRYDVYNSTIPNALVYIILISKTKDTDIGFVKVNGNNDTLTTIESVMISDKTLTIKWAVTQNRICWFVPIL